MNLPLLDLPELPGLDLDLEPALPKDWIEITAPDGSVYYHNQRTNQVQWERPGDDFNIPPPLSAAPGVNDLPAAPLPPSIALPSPINGAPTLPNVPDLFEVPMLPVVPIVSQNTSTDASELPPDWQAVKDDSGNTYYWNSSTNETTWTKPIRSASDVSPTLLIGPVGVVNNDNKVQDNIEETMKMFQLDKEERERADAQKRKNELARKGVSEKEFQKMEKKRLEEELKKQKKEKEKIAKQEAKSEDRARPKDKEVALKIGNFDLDTAKKRLEEQQKAAEEKIRKIREEEEKLHQQQVAEQKRIQEEQRARDEQLRLEREEAERQEQERRLIELKKQREIEEERLRKEEEQRLFEERRLAMLAEEQRKKEEEELRIKHEAEERVRKAEEERRRIDEEIKRAQYEEQKARKEEEERKRKLLEESRIKQETERIAGLERARQAEEERIKKLAIAQTNALMSDLGLDDDDETDILCEVFMEPNRRLGPLSVPSDMRISAVRTKIRDSFKIQGEFNMRVKNSVILASRDNDFAATILSQADAIVISQNAPARAPAPAGALSMGDLDSLLGLTGANKPVPANAPVAPQRPPPQPTITPAAQAAVVAAASQSASGTLTLTPAAQELAKQIEPAVRNQIITTVQGMTPAAKKQLAEQLRGQEKHARANGKALPVAHQLYMLLLTEVAPNVPLQLQQQIKDAVEKMPASQRSLLLTQLRAKPNKTAAESYYVECLEKKMAGVELESVDDLSLDDVDVLEPGGRKPPQPAPAPQPGDGVPPQLIKQIKDTVANLPLPRRQQLLADLTRKKQSGPVSAAEDFYIFTLKNSMQQVQGVVAPQGLNSGMQQPMKQMGMQQPMGMQPQMGMQQPMGMGMQQPMGMGMQQQMPGANLPPQLRMQIENAVANMAPPQARTLMGNLMQKKNSGMPLADPESYYLLLLWKRYGNC